MPRLYVTTREGIESVVEGQAGNSVMEAIRDSGLDELLALCGGCCSCATCHVYVDESLAQNLPTMGESENDLLDSSSHRSSRSRLACQIPLSEELDGLRITIAPED